MQAKLPPRASMTEQHSRCKLPTSALFDIAHRAARDERQCTTLRQKIGVLAADAQHIALAVGDDEDGAILPARS